MDIIFGNIEMALALITTIPKTYVKALNIKYGDTLEWILDTETETLKLKVVK